MSVNEHARREPLFRVGIDRRRTTMPGPTLKGGARRNTRSLSRSTSWPRPSLSASGAETFDWDEKYGEGTFEDESTTPELGRFLQQYGGLPPGGNVRYSEGTLELGETAHVLGTARREGPDLVLCKHEDAPLYVADAALLGR